MPSLPPSPTDWEAHFKARDTAYHARTAGTATRYYTFDGEIVVKLAQREYFCVNPDADVTLDTDSDADGDVNADSSSTIYSASNSDSEINDANHTGKLHSENTTTTTASVIDTAHDRDHDHETPDADTNPPSTPSTLLTNLTRSANETFTASMRARDRRNRERVISQRRLAELKAGRVPVGDGEVETLGLYDLGTKECTGEVVELKGKGKWRRDSGIAREGEGI